MKKLSLLLAFSAAFVMAPMAFAQDVDKEKTKEELKGKSDQQLKEELDGLTKDISKGMDKVKKGLNEAALPRRKADELRVELEAALEKLKKGEAEELHKGLREYLGENPDKLAELLKLQRDEAVKLLEDDAALLKKLSENADKAADLMKDVEALEDVLKRQEAIEKSMEEVKDALKKGESTENHIERVLDILQEAKRRAKPWGGGSWSSGDGAGQPQPGEQPGKEGQEKKEGEEAKGEGSGQGPEGVQDSGKDSAAGSKPNEIEERTPSGDVMKARLQGKDAEQATSKDSEKAKDPKYEGMKRVFDKMRRRLGK